MPYRYQMRFLLYLSLWWVGTAMGQPWPDSTDVASRLVLNPFADTGYHASSAALIQTVDRFLAGYATQGQGNDFWLSEDYERYRYPYAELYYWLGEGYTATLLDLVATADSQQYLVKVAFMTTAPALQGMYTFLALQQADGTWRLARSLRYNTRHWREVQVGNIRYVVSPHHQFDRAEAERFNRFNDTLAQFFGGPPLTNLTYYLAVNPAELFRIRGFDYHPVMFKFDKGGQNEVWAGIIYSANNSAWYPHELVHSYTYKYYGRSINRIFDEGLATYLGGSNDLPLEHHLTNVQRYLDEHPDSSALKLLYQNTEIYQRETACMYAIGGLFCKKALEEKGKPALEQLLQAGRTKADFLSAMEQVFGLKEPELDAFIRRALVAYRKN